MPISANSEKIQSKRWRLAIVCIFLLSVGASPLPVLSANIDLHSDTEKATAGYFRLSWSVQDAGSIASIEFQLQEAANAQVSVGQIVYQGPDLARVISGKPDGDYYYRIRMIKDGESPSEWSDVIRVTVAHHSLTRAMSFFLAGALVFFSLLIFILTQQKKN